MVISFSLWGADPKYIIGAIKNSIIAKDLFPGWVCRFYIGQSTVVEVPEAINQLKKLANVELIYMQSQGNWESMFWRFLAFSDENIDVVICRDTDSRLTKREKSAINQWLNSTKNFHIIRDHPYHSRKILGGMWGGRGDKLKEMKSLINSFVKEDYYQVDQDFLEEIIYPIISNDVFIHDEFTNQQTINIKRKNYEFIGDVFNENDERDPNYWKEIRRIKYSFLYRIQNKLINIWNFIFI